MTSLITDHWPLTTQKATFAAGCFWGVQEAFETLPGVAGTRVGYIGGRTDAPTYKEVCNGNTNHAEALEIDYDEAKISYRELVNFFFKLHDPTTLNRQGPDIGSQYRSAIFTHSAQQEQVARETVEELKRVGAFNRPIVTQIVAAPTFWPAEEYHQHYFKKQGISGGCHI